MMSSVDRDPPQPRSSDWQLRGRVAVLEAKIRRLPKGTDRDWAIKHLEEANRLTTEGVRCRD